MGHNLGLYHDGPCGPLAGGVKDTDPFCRLYFDDDADSDGNYDEDPHDQQPMKIYFNLRFNLSIFKVSGKSAKNPLRI